MRSLGNDNPHKNEPLVCVFPLHTQIIKVIAPTRYNAAFSLDCALLIVFDNGEVQYVKRHVSGGSVPLLISHHRRRQASSSMEEVYRLLLLSAEEQQKQDGLGTLSSSKTHLHAHRDNEILYGTLPHITYQYQLSPKSKFSFATPDGGVFINDAQLLYDKTAGDMLLVVAGGERTYVAHKQNNNNNRVANSYDRLSSSSAVTSTKQYNETRLSGSVAAENNNNNDISVRVAPFWGIAEHAVLPLYATENIIKKENQFSHNNNHPKNIEVRVLAHTVSLPEVQQQSLHDHHHNNINTFRYHAARQSAFSSVSVLPNNREKETGVPLLFSSLQNLYQTTSSFQKQNSENINNSRLPQLAHVFSASSVMEEVAVADGAVLYGSNSEVSVLRF
ncbi:hypothetical protein AGDE_15157 [Angomonas deanei]|uniref:Uncharacterized protein n=1 Tax=Angomonas deanei TaxID=59799 RepID=A0A7G2CNA6_9TRYP|nr:hypothetical protein AGDE_15157 [Angomonas deanei]CAD2220401.1 hypothetical protein, conserved [Angomonas deanei]|eukprot:EPY19605.1 hypothetical protein AGDE_15157 [Angomonas deanei]